MFNIAVDDFADRPVIETIHPSVMQPVAGGRDSLALCPLTF